ncbi:hypothetical protein CCR75_001718 [Bremia lactucae]|uniref:Uncharacterized protein n=1 Tax=Bremia lactucae TaxID=4779 RepID=A0A976FGK6_BRELC|nr:hypothetical protein CCR75_001718 [Bremia lactucae]
MAEYDARRKITPLPTDVDSVSGRCDPHQKCDGEVINIRTLNGREKPFVTKKGVVLTESRMWRLLYAMFITAFGICLICLVVLGHIVQDNSIANNGIKGLESTSQGLLALWKDTQVLSKLKRLSQTFTPMDANNITRQLTKQELRNLSDFECLGWRQTNDCSPLGEREMENDKNCTESIKNGMSGYCEVRNTHTGELRRVLSMHCNSLRAQVAFTCNMFQSLLRYSILSTDYEHDKNFSYEKNQVSFQTTNYLDSKVLPVDNNKQTNKSVNQLKTLSFERGIVFVVFKKILLGAYVSVRTLREFGCNLPIEMWYKTSETDRQHPLLQLMVDQLGVYLRVIEDPLATHFYTKLYAIFYSAFDNVLLLDADNFAVRDPSYLFDTPEFVETGAIFWPDFWRPANTIFNIHDQSYVWDFFGLDYVDSFEQESGQVMINRRMHYKALNVLMYYGFSMPRVHQKLRLVWGDKDLFRFAWMKSQSSFFMTQRPPGSAGTKHPDYNLFCGVTMVQHDPSGNVIFLHRNTEKLTFTNNRILWTHLQQYKNTSSLSNYVVRGANGGKVFAQFKRCFGKDVHYDKLFTLQPMSAFPFENLERNILQFTAAGAEVVRLAGLNLDDDR